MKNLHAHESAAHAYHHGDLRRTLVQAALAIVTEEQDWAFSLRELARRAGVSHNAPYNHFADKRELLAEVAAAGLDTLCDKMLGAIEGIDDPASALLATGQAYVRTGVENPALYRLIAGPALGAEGERPAVAKAAGERTRKVLEQIIERGAQTGTFAIASDGARGRAAVLLAWSVVHGLTMLAIDGLAVPRLSTDQLVEGVTEILLNGLRPK